MMHKKRGYKREDISMLVRDYKLFAIACEGGRREPEYFKTFEYLSRKIKVDVIEDKIVEDDIQLPETKSSPKWVLDRAMKYIEQEGLIDEDQLWFVMDIDKWSHDQLYEVAQYCEQHSNWQIVLSNPSFEVWLYFHKNKTIGKTVSKTANDFKKEISELEKGGYHPYKFIPNLPDAIKNAKAADTDRNHYLPKFKQTKVYQLGEALMLEIGNNDFDRFVKVTLPKLIQEDIAKAKKSKIMK